MEKFIRELRRLATYVKIMYKSLYPSIIRQFNVAAHTQIGMLVIPEQIHANENRRHAEQWSRGGAFIEDFQSHQWLETGTRWFNLPSYEALVEFVKRVFTTMVRPTNSFGFENSQGGLYFPVIIKKDYRPVWFTPVQSPELQDALMEWRNYVAEHPNQQF